ncbi:MAG: hypothetical protein RL119_1332, partial [Actinomycetota bacterium]
MSAQLSHPRIGRSLISSVVGGFLLLSACGNSGSTETSTDSLPTTVTSDSFGAPASGRTLRVPQDYRTVQGAVDSAAEGDLILISPG